MYTLIEHKKLDTAAASITFSNIPQNFTDLYLVTSLRSTISATAVTARVKFNSSDANFSLRRLIGLGNIGVGSDTGSYTNEFVTVTGANSSANTFSSVGMYIPNYRGSNSKAFSIDSVYENNATTAYTIIYSSNWAQSEAINSIELYPNTDSFSVGSSATLYGINRTSAIGKPKAIGGNITYANGYWVHTFTGSGTFYAQEDLEVDALVVAGGGGGCGAYGGAGAGGFLALSSLNISSGSVPILVGAGGTPTSTPIGNNGSDSFFGSNKALGGGGGRADANGLPGGSGGGGGGPGYSGGLGTAGQGNNGGVGAGTSGFQAGGGGGGAGAVGGNAPGNQSGGNGGAGAIWDGAYYAGGGGGAGYGNSGTSTGGSGGIGGGGRGAAQVGATTLQTPTAGTTNTGGGGGTGMNSLGAAGGSGVVIVRYRAD